MIYFDNAASGGRKPDNVLSAVASSIKVCANPGRSGHKLAVACAGVVQQARSALHQFFNGYNVDNVVFTKNCTEALNIALLGLLQKGDHVVITPMEHNSVLRPLAHLQRQGIITYDVCEPSKDGNVTKDAIAKCLRKNTRLVAVTAASNVTGATPPLAEIRQVLPTRVLFLCDGAQGGGHLPIDMQALGIDVLTLAGHKGLMGIQGGGVLLFSDHAQPRPILYGGTGSISLSLDMPDFYPDALEAGTLNFPAVVSLLEGVRFLQTTQTAIARQMLDFTTYFLHYLSTLPDYKAFSTPNVCGIVAFAHKTLQSEQIAAILSERFSIAVRGGLHCAPLMHEALTTLDGGLVRVSFSHFNQKSEIDVLLSALRTIRQTASPAI